LGNGYVGPEPLRDTGLVEELDTPVPEAVGILVGPTPGEEELPSEKGAEDDVADTKTDPVGDVLVDRPELPEPAPLPGWLDVNPVELAEG
jgi:hypothetical protein